MWVEKIPYEERRQADFMIKELQEQSLVVVLIPAPDPQFIGHMIRSAVERNPIWYRGEGLRRKECFISLNRIRFDLPLSSETDYRVHQIVKNELDKLRNGYYH